MYGLNEKGNCCASRRTRLVIFSRQTTGGRLRMEKAIHAHACLLAPVTPPLTYLTLTHSHLAHQRVSHQTGLSKTAVSKCGPGVDWPT